jgi:hypothetical protein
MDEREISTELNEKKSKYPKTITEFIETVRERSLPEPEPNLTRNEVSDSHTVTSVAVPAKDELGVRSSNENSFPNMFNIFEPVELR